MEGAAARGPSPWLGFGTCCAIWGSTFLFIRIGNDAAPPVWSAAVRLSLPAPLVALGAVTASGAGVLLKRAPGGHPFATNAWAHAVGALVCWPVSLGLGEPQGLPGAAAWIPIAYLTLVGSLGAFATFAWLLQRWTVTRTSFIAVVVPVVALLLGAIVRHEHPGG